MNRWKVGVLGATGMVGQRFISLLDNHPWFEVASLAASGRSAGKTYQECIANRWKMSVPVPKKVQSMLVRDVTDIDGVSQDVDFLFSAVDMTKEEIRAIEEAYAKRETPVISNNSAHRWTPDVPMVIPEINIDHFHIIPAQRKRLGTKRGFIAVKPNCSIQGYVPALAAWKEYEPYEVCVSTYQAISGAGKTFADWPEMVDNIIPYISGEEEKSEKEPLKIFGSIQNGAIVNADQMKITAQCLRVPVPEGHTCACFVRFRNKASKEDLIQKLRDFSAYPQEAHLPSAPQPFIKYFNEEDRPQVKKDVLYEKGFGVTMGRLREDSLFDYKFIGLAHNTVRGAAGGAILCAEALASLGYLEKK